MKIISALLNSALFIKVFLKGLLSDLAIGLIGFRQLLKGSREIELLAEALDKKDCSNIIYVDGVQVKTFLQQFQSLLKLRRLHGSIIIVRTNREQYRTFFTSKKLKINIFFSNTFMLHEGLSQIQSFVTNIYSGDQVISEKRKKIFVLPVIGVELRSAWSMFVAKNRLGLFYDMDYLDEHINTKEQCFLYLSEHNVEAVETRKFDGDVGIKRSGLRVRRKNNNEKNSKYMENFLDLIEICYRHRKAGGMSLTKDTFDDLAVPMNLYRYQSRVAIYGNQKCSFEGKKFSLSSLETRHRTAYRNAKKSGWTLDVTKQAVGSQELDGGALCRAEENLDTSEKPTQKYRCIVRAGNGDAVGGIEVIEPSTSVGYFYYVKSLAHGMENRISSSQVFAIVEFIFMYCDEGSKFEFLGARDPAIFKFFRGFGSTQYPVVEVVW